ncbi:transcription termination factor NusA [bacterium]|nr:transcription termination factor NusA [bacterium]
MSSFMESLKLLSEEKNIPIEVLKEALETAIGSAFKKNFGKNQEIRVEINEDTAKIRIFSEREVVEDELGNSSVQITLEDARKIDNELDIGDIVEEEVTPDNINRIAAQTAKQVILQKIREAEKNQIFEEFNGKIGKIIIGKAQKIDKDPDGRIRKLMVDLGKLEVILLRKDLLKTDHFSTGDTVKIVIEDIVRNGKGPELKVSRSCGKFLKALFENEIPEIQDGIIEIKEIARDPGNRTKMAVHSKDSNIDPVGACVGYRGSRIQGILDEINNEKIDIVRWHEKIETFISNALAPAKVISIIMDEGNKGVKVVVPEDQLSLAIGREGQNVRLAARLVGYRIDIKSVMQEQDKLNIFKEI